MSRRTSTATSRASCDPACTTYRHALETADIGGLPPAERTRRHLERFMEEIGCRPAARHQRARDRSGRWRRSSACSAPSLGIISAFQGIAATGSGGLSAVSAGISEALIETALGLAVAIPAVLVFNYLSSMITREELLLKHSAGELLDTIEDWEERAPPNGDAERPVRLERGSAPERARERGAERDRPPLAPTAACGPTINVTPLVDVVLVLLIIFMVVAPRLDQDVQVDLPGIFNPDPDVDSGEPLKVHVTKAGEYHFNERGLRPRRADQSARGRARRRSAAPPGAARRRDAPATATSATLLEPPAARSASRACRSASM